MIEAASWSRFKSNWLEVTRDVVGRSHKFEFEGRHVEVKLPPEEHADRGNSYDETIGCFSWKRRHGKDIPQSFHIFKVDLTIDLENTIQVRRELLELPPKQMKFVTQNKKLLFDNIVCEHEILANRAFDYWIRVVRWKAGWWRIGQPEVGDQRSGWGTYLIEKQSNHRFWTGTVRLVAQLPHVVTTDEWDEVQQAASEGSSPPLWFEFLYDAQHKLDIGDSSGCILSLAIACESMFRHVLNKQVPTAENADRRLFDTLSEINIRAIFRKITKFKF